MSTLPRAQKPKVPLLRVPLECDQSLSDSEVQYVLKYVCVCVRMCVRERRAGLDFIGVECRCFAYSDDKIPDGRHLKPQQWIIVWRSVAEIVVIWQALL